MKTAIFLVSLFVTLTICAQSVTSLEIEKIVTKAIGEKDPSLFVGVVKNGMVSYSGVRGLANLQHQVKANSASSSNIASVAKQFTALCILKLSLENKLSLEDDIREYLPKLYPNITDSIKIRHLLNHSSGIRDYADLMSLQQNPWWRQEGLDNHDVITLIEKQNDLNFTPGSEYLYSNTNYTLLTKVVAVVSGVSFHDYSKRLFVELGLKNTRFLKNYMAVIPNQVLPYSDWGDGIWRQYPMLTNLHGDGFLFTTLEDQLIFEKAIQNAEQTNNQLLLQSQKEIPNSEIATYGFGLELTDRLNRKAVHHSGSTGSYHAQTIRFPEEKLSVFVMSSNSRIWSGSIADKIASKIQSNTQEVKKDDYLSQIPKIEAIDSNKLPGFYKTSKGKIVRIIEKQGMLYYQVDNNNPFKLIKETTGYYAFESSPDIKIVFTQTGDTAKLLLYRPGTEPRIHTKLPEAQLQGHQLDAFIGQYQNEELNISFEITKEDDAIFINRKKYKRPQKVEILTPYDFLVSDYKLVIKRDIFNRVNEILLTTNRLKNVRFTKKTNLIFQPKINLENTSIQVTTIPSKKQGSTILLTKNYENGNEIWTRQFGGKSYDKASSLIKTEDGGYLIIGATSSFGKGNYDVYVIKVDSEGREQWNTVSGYAYNDYGYTAEQTDSGFLIKSTTQKCDSNSNIADANCETYTWFIELDEKGKEIKNKILKKF